MDDTDRNVFIWFTARLLAKGTEGKERHQKGLNQKTEGSCGLLQDAVNIILSSMPNIGTVQVRCLTGINITVVKSDTSHHFCYCNEAFDVTLDCLSLFIPYSSR